MKANKISSDTIFKSNNYGDFRILNDFYDNEKKRRYAIIEFVDTGYSYKVRYCEAIKGCVKDPFRPSIFNVGYIGNAHKKGNEKLYNTWLQIISRCYNSKDVVFDLYGGRGIYVDDRWHNFEYFLEDVCMLPGYNEMINNPNEKYELDKDYLSNKNKKCYSKTTCIWIPKDTNNRIHLVQNHKNCTSKYFGVVFDKRFDSYQVQINYKGKQYYLGKYDSEEVAANVYNHYARKLGITITLNDCEFISFEDCMKAKKTKRKLKIDSIIQEELL